jgi:hypothetical protein
VARVRKLANMAAKTRNRRETLLVTDIRWTTRLVPSMTKGTLAFELHSREMAVTTNRQVMCYDPL